jgi:PAS domain S-box-containing protein
LKLNEPLQRELPMRGRTYLFTVAPAAGFSYANFYGTDVTARKQAEDALRAREMELETIINRTPFMLTRCTRDLHYAFVSQAYAQMLGRNPSDIIGKPIAQIMGDEGFKTILPHVNKVLEGVAVHYEEAVHFQGVGQRSLEVTYKPERNENGHVTGWIASILDVSSRKEAERALSTAHTQLADRAVHLEKLVAERTAKLREMVGELQHVSYAIVHDMRAPLRAMSAFADALLTDLSVSSGASELLDYCRRIIAGSARLDKLIQDSLNYTKAVLQEVPLKPVDLNPLIKSLLDTYPNLQPDKADITIDGKLPVVLGDESLLTQCFSNLLGNAVKFVPRGVRPQIQVRAESSSANGLTRVTVQDNGIGFAANAQARLFGMFQRFTNDYEGTGIGLAIVRKVTERMGGRVGADSEPGKGSRFWVELRTPNSADHSQPNSST